MSSLHSSERQSQIAGDRPVPQSYPSARGTMDDITCLQQRGQLMTPHSGTADGGMGVDDVRPGPRPTFVQRETVRTNKNGQQLGRKGIETRQRLMEATRRLLVTISPFALSALLVTREARTAPATFYVYFDDTQDLLFALCAETGGEMVDLFENDRLLRDPATLYRDAHAFVHAFNGVWDRHSNILLYRNLEADRGDPRFDKLRTEAAIPTMDALADRLTVAYPPTKRPKPAVIYAEAVVFYVALERLAAAVHQYPDEGLSVKDLIEAQARVLVRLLEPR